jgi:hypothetical protein
VHYIFLLNDREERWATMTDEVMAREIGAYAAYTKALREAGAYVGGDRLESVSTATTVRVGSDGKTSVLDGPYPDTKEQLGGYYVVDLPDMDAAISWAARCPCASHGTVEIRPIASVPATA